MVIAEPSGKLWLACQPRMPLLLQVSTVLLLLLLLLSAELL